ncbi:MAG: DUF262 domain-containing protein [Treponema sp.]
MNNSLFDENELLFDGIKSGVSEEYEDTTDIEPFDPKKISITKKNIALDVVIRRMKRGTIRLTPDFQRNAVWSDKQKSLLIESLMLNIPIPMFYVAADEEGNWDVVDGLQRLTSLKEYLIDNSLKINNLEFWKEYKDKTIDDLPPVIYNRIYETEFTFVIIEPNTPENVKYNIFKRINTGGKPLSPQEIRNALYNGKGTKLLQTLAHSYTFRIATDNSINDLRMTAQECVLRYLSYLLVGTDGYFEKDFADSFLIRNLRILNNLDNIKDKSNYVMFKDGKNPKILVNSYDELIDLFNKGLKRNKDFFEKDAFRLMSIKTKKRTPINRALLETLGTLFARLSDDDFKKLLTLKEAFLEKYEKVRITNEFYRAVSRDPWTKENVDYRFKVFEKIIQETIQ